MNQKQRKEIRDKIVNMLLYMCDPAIKDQWKCCEAYADIIISEIIYPLLKEQNEKTKRRTNK